MPKRFLRFTFEREAKWMVALLLLPLLGMLFSVVAPRLLQ
jgi:hypothetical protein